MSMHQRKSQKLRHKPYLPINWTGNSKKKNRRLRKKRENELKKTEKAIEKLEQRDKAEIDEEMTKPEIATNVAECPAFKKKGSKRKVAKNWKLFQLKWKSWPNRSLFPFVKRYWI